MVTRVKWRGEAEPAARRRTGSCGDPGHSKVETLVPGEPSADLTSPGSATGSADTVAGPVDG